eukprot:scaffold12239_cov48-Phaeocystis_antarctica.AAC.2
MQQKRAGETISQQVVHQPRRFSRPFFLRIAVSCELHEAERSGASMPASLTASSCGGPAARRALGDSCELHDAERSGASMLWSAAQEEGGR